MEYLTAVMTLITMIASASSMFVYLHKCSQLNYWRAMTTSVLQDGEKYVAWANIAKGLFLTLFFLLVCAAAELKQVNWDWYTYMVPVTLYIAVFSTCCDIPYEYICNHDFTPKKMVNLFFCKNIWLPLVLLGIISLRLVANPVKFFVSEKTVLQNMGAIAVITGTILFNILVLGLSYTGLGKGREKRRKIFEIVTERNGVKYAVVFSEGKAENTIVERAIVDAEDGILKIDTTQYWTISMLDIVAREKRCFKTVIRKPESVAELDSYI